jgi:hypothetical protein
MIAVCNRGSTVLVKLTVMREAVHGLEEGLHVQGGPELDQHASVYVGE